MLKYYQILFTQLYKIYKSRLFLYINSNIQKQPKMTTQKYSTLVQQPQPTILQHYASIIEFKKTQAKVNLLISAQETQEQQKAQLIQMKENLDTALKEELAQLRAKEKKDEMYPLSIELLTEDDVGKLVKYYIVEEKKWKNAKLIEVDLEEQTARIKKYGINNYQEEQISLPAYLLKVLKQPNHQLFQQGTHCKAIYSGDGQFYPCVIQKIDQAGYHVKYKKYNSQQVIQLHRLRPIQNPNQKPQQIANFQNLTEFKVPEKLKILPNDPENVKKSKKSKIKALKFSFKNAQVEQFNKQKQDKWKSWNSGGMGSKMGHFKVRQDMQVIKSGEKEAVRK